MNRFDLILGKKPKEDLSKGEVKINRKKVETKKNLPDSEEILEDAVFKNLEKNSSIATCDSETLDVLGRDHLGLTRFIRETDSNFRGRLLRAEKLQTFYLAKENHLLGW